MYLVCISSSYPFCHDLYGGVSSLDTSVVECLSVRLAPRDPQDERDPDSLSSAGC